MLDMILGLLTQEQKLEAVKRVNAEGQTLLDLVANNPKSLKIIQNHIAQEPAKLSAFFQPAPAASLVDLVEKQSEQKLG